MTKRQFAMLEDLLWETLLSGYATVVIVVIGPFSITSVDYPREFFSESGKAGIQELLVGS